VDDLQRLLIQIHNQVDSSVLRDLDPAAHKRLAEDLRQLEVHVGFANEIIFASQLLTLPHHQSLWLLDQQVLLSRCEVVDPGHCQRELLKLFRARHFKSCHAVSRVNLSSLPPEMLTMLLPLRQKTQTHFVVAPDGDADKLLRLQEFGLCDDFVPPPQVAASNAWSVRILAKAEHALATGKMQVALFFYLWLALKNGFSAGDERVRRFRVDLFGGLAVCLGHFYLDFALVWDCLCRMHRRGAFWSDRLTLLVAQQRVFAFYGLFAAEHRLFVLLHHRQCLPSRALLFRDSVTCHFESLLSHCENVVLELRLDLFHHRRCSGFCGQTRRSALVEECGDLLAHLRSVADQLKHRTGVPEVLRKFLTACQLQSHLLEGFLVQWHDDLEASQCFERAFNIMDTLEESDLPKAFAPYSFFRYYLKNFRVPDDNDWDEMDAAIECLRWQADAEAAMVHSHLSCQISFAYLLASFCFFGHSARLVFAAGRLSEKYGHLTAGRHHRIPLLQRAEECFSETMALHEDSPSLELNFLGATARTASDAAAAARRNRTFAGVASDVDAVANYFAAEPISLPRILQFAFAVIRGSNRF